MKIELTPRQARLLLNALGSYEGDIKEAMPKYPYDSERERWKAVLKECDELVDMPIEFV